MADYFKKRRTPGPDKNEQKIMRARNAQSQARAGGTITANFPTVSHLKIHLTFYNAQQHLLDEKMLTLGPSDYAVFSVACPGRCGSGSFDFAAKVAETVAAGLAASDSSAKCPERLYAGSADACGCEVKCRMEINYLPAETPK